MEITKNNLKSTLAIQQNKMIEHLSLCSNKDCHVCKNFHNNKKMKKCWICGEEAELKYCFDTEYGPGGYERIINESWKCYGCYEKDFLKTFPNEPKEKIKEMFEEK